MTTELKQITNSFHKTEELENVITQFYEDLKIKYEQGKFGDWKWYYLIKEFEHLMEDKLLRLNVDNYVKYMDMKD